MDNSGNPLAGLTGISRSKLFERMKSGERRIVKLEVVTLILVDSLYRFIEAKRH